MDDIIQEKDISRQIETIYGFSIKSFVQAPRGWWAETHILDTNKGKYFIKIYIDDMSYENELYASIHKQYEIAKYIDYIPKPEKTKSGDFLPKLDNKRIMALYSFIDGEKYSCSNANEILKLMIPIYKLDIKGLNKNPYYFYGEKIVEDLRNSKYDVKSDIWIDFLKINSEALIKYWDYYKIMYNNVITKGKDIYLTHGDLGANLMIDRTDKIFIVDWDSISLGPIERDLREFIDINTDINELERTAKNAGFYWEFDKDYHNYYILNNLYDDLGILFSYEQNDNADKVIGQQKNIDNMERKLII